MCTAFLQSPVLLVYPQASGVSLEATGASLEALLPVPSLDLRWEQAHALVRGTHSSIGATCFLEC